ncbi:hypothetical protein SAMN04488168_101431 [Bacillus sp. 491mf]|nr:hypothetical protein SAMN04488168_101431 [Bacillus sp. 491mf]
MGMGNRPHFINKFNHNFTHPQYLIVKILHEITIKGIILVEWTVIDEQKVTSYLVQVSHLDKNFLFHIREIDDNIDINLIDENNNFLTPVPVELFLSKLLSEEDKMNFKREYRNMSGLVLLEPLTREESIYVREMTKEEAVIFRYLEDTFSRDSMNKVESPLM